MNKNKRLLKKLNAIKGITAKPRYQRADDAPESIAIDDAAVSRPVMDYLHDVPSALKPIMGKTLSQLLHERRPGELPTLPTSYPVRHMHELYDTVVSRFTVEDVRFLIAQQTALEEMVPLAMCILEEDILASGDFYDGDLLQALLRLPDDYWMSRPAIASMLVKMLKAENNYIAEGIDDKDLQENINRFMERYQ
ncbi:MAG: hypothetical protein IJV05_09955 [Muribaculaceae bacterium]|nr:hypothetical protein [Muribaculaceae bacterium]